MLTGIAFSVITIVQFNSNLMYFPYFVVALITIVPGIYGVTVITGQEKYQRLINEDIY